MKLTELDAMVVSLNADASLALRMAKVMAQRARAAKEVEVLLARICDAAIDNASWAGKYLAAAEKLGGEHLKAAQEAVKLLDADVEDMEDDYTNAVDFANTASFSAVGAEFEYRVAADNARVARTVQKESGESSAYSTRRVVDLARLVEPEKVGVAQ